ncbi:MAG: hypothetical protein LBO77_00770 [Desulfovibrio sp.]|jgi:multimeric flavodoxin WrbA|nr:hypothetical protein [Desulfovibrio sp.]
MPKKLLLHDLKADLASDLLPDDSDKYMVFPAQPAVHHCIGCFGCWLKTPGRCLIADRGADFISLLSRCTEFILLSRMVFGGLSPDIKAILDRSIGFVSPFFRDIAGEMHHVRRFDNTPDFRYIFYGASISRPEQETAQKVAAANSRNLGSGRFQVLFFPTARQGAEALP